MFEFFHLILSQINEDIIFVRAFVDRVNDAIECVVKLDFPHLVVQRDLQLDQVLPHVLS